MKNSDFSYLLNEISAWIDPKMPDIMVIEKIAKLMNNQERLASSLNERNHNLFSKNENNSKGFFSAFHQMKKSFCITYISIKKTEGLCHVMSYVI